MTGQQGHSGKHTHNGAQHMARIVVLVTVLITVLVTVLVTVLIRVMFFSVTVMVRPHLETTRSEDPDDAEGQKCRNLLGAMCSPTQNQGTETKGNGHEREEPLDRLPQQEAEPETRKNNGKEGTNCTVKGTQCTRHGAQSVRHFF